MAEQPDISFDIIDSLPERPSEGSDTAHPADATGDSPLVQTLYEGPRKCTCCINWVDYLPPNADANDDKDDEDLPLVVRHSVIRGEDASRVAIHSVDVRDPATREALFPVFEGFDKINPSINYLVFHAPFKPFFYRWSRFEEALNSCTAPHTKAILGQLHAIVKAELAEAFAIWDELVENGVISYPYLWTIFQPGEIICQDIPGGTPRFYYLEELEEADAQARACQYHRLPVKHVDLDGRFGLARYHFCVWSFQGTRRITDLPVYPACFIPDLPSVKQAVIARGWKLAALAGVHYKEYAPGGEGTRQGRRIVVDSHGDTAYKPVLEPLKPGSEMICDTWGITQAPLDGLPVGGHTSLRLGSGDDGAIARELQRDLVTPEYGGDWGNREYRRGRGERGDLRRRPRGPPPPRRLPSPDYSGGDDHEEPQELDEIHLLICTNTIGGFCLQKRAWETFPVDSIRDIEWSGDPFSTLVLPDGYKDLLLSFVETHIGGEKTFGDVIHGKGSGLVVSLSGPPGVGKTLTAESVAEVLRVPLYVLDLGQVSDELEDNGVSRPAPIDKNGRTRPTIADSFAQAARWKALLLVDECDLYLEPRSEATPMRNRIVTKFLREVEYSSSLLFLTTNRPGALDPAIASRIHLTVTYPTLDPDSRRAIWKTLLAYHGAPALSARSLDRLADLKLNGRKIRNVAKAAAIMASRNKRRVEYGDIKTVLRITEGLGMTE